VPDDQSREFVVPIDEVVVIEHQVEFVRHGRQLVEHRHEDGLDRRLSRLQEPGAGPTVQALAESRTGHQTGP
jgi:hypothetical protein